MNYERTTKAKTFGQALFSTMKKRTFFAILGLILTVSAARSETLAEVLAKARQSRATLKSGHAEIVDHDFEALTQHGVEMTGSVDFNERAVVGTLKITKTIGYSTHYTGRDGVRQEGIQEGEQEFTFRYRSSGLVPEPMFGTLSKDNTVQGLTLAEKGSQINSLVNALRSDPLLVGTVIPSTSDLGNLEREMQLTKGGRTLTGEYKSSAGELIRVAVATDHDYLIQDASASKDGVTTRIQIVEFTEVNGVSMPALVKISIAGQGRNFDQWTRYSGYTSPADNQPIFDKLPKGTYVYGPKTVYLADADGNLKAVRPLASVTTVNRLPKVVLFLSGMVAIFTACTLGAKRILRGMLKSTESEQS